MPADEHSVREVGRLHVGERLVVELLLKIEGVVLRMREQRASVRYLQRQTAAQLQRAYDVHAGLQPHVPAGVDRPLNRPRVVVGHAATIPPPQHTSSS